VTPEGIVGTVVVGVAQWEAQETVVVVSLVDWQRRLDSVRLLCMEGSRMIGRFKLNASSGMLMRRMEGDVEETLLVQRG
jgi:hypothetical protein